MTTAGCAIFTWAQTNPLESGSIPMASLAPIRSLPALTESTVPFRHPCNELLLPLRAAGICFIRPERSLWRWQSPTESSPATTADTPQQQRHKEVLYSSTPHQRQPARSTIHISPSSPRTPSSYSSSHLSSATPILQADALSRRWHGRPGWCRLWARELAAAQLNSMLCPPESGSIARRGWDYLRSRLKSQRAPNPARVPCVVACYSRVHADTRLPDTHAPVAPTAF